MLVPKLHVGSLDLDTKGTQVDVVPKYVSIYVYVETFFAIMRKPAPVCFIATIDVIVCLVAVVHCCCAGCFRTIEGF